MTEFGWRFNSRFESRLGIFGQMGLGPYSAIAKKINWGSELNVMLEEVVVR